MKYSYNKSLNKVWHKTSTTLMAVVFGFLFTFGPLTGVQAKDETMGVVNVNYVGWENQGEPDDYQRTLIHATETGDGFIRTDRAPVTEDWTDELVNDWRVFWGAGEVSCVNVVENRAVIVAQFTDVGEFPLNEYPAGTLAEYFLDSWMAVELTDNGTGDTDTIRQVMEIDYETGDTYSKQDLMSFCDAGTVGDAGFEPFVGYHSGDIVIYETDPSTFGETEESSRKLAIPEEIDQFGEGEYPGMLNHGCEGGVYTLINGKYSDDFKFTYYPNKEAVETGQLGAFVDVQVDAKFSGEWDLDTDPGSLYDLTGEKSISNHVMFWPNGTDLSYLSWEGAFIDAETDVVSDWWNIDIVNNADGVASGISEGTCGGITNWDSYNLGYNNEDIGVVEADFLLTEDEALFYEINIHANEFDQQEAWMRVYDNYGFEDQVNSDLHCVNVSEDGQNVLIVGQVNSAGSDTYQSIHWKWFIAQLVDGEQVEGLNDGVWISSLVEDGLEDDIMQMCTDGDADPEGMGWHYSPVYEGDIAIFFTNNNGGGGGWGDLEGELGMGAGFDYTQVEDNMSFVPWEDQRRVHVDAFYGGPEDNNISWTIADGGDPLVQGNLQCANIGFEGPVTYANLAGQIYDSSQSDLVGEWFFLQIGYDESDEETDGALYLHNGGLFEEPIAFEMCENVTPDIELYPNIEWQSVVIPSADGWIDFFELGNGGGGEEFGSIHASFETLNLFNTPEIDGDFQLFQIHNVTEELDNPEVFMVFEYQSGILYGTEFEEPQAISQFELTCVNIAEDGGSAFVAGYVGESDDTELVGKSFVIQLVDGETDGIYWSIPAWDQSQEAVLITCEEGMVDPVAEEWNYSEAWAWDENGEPVDAINIQPAQVN